MIVVEHVAGRVGMARCGSLAGGHGSDSRYSPQAPMGGGGTPMYISVTLITRPIF